MSQPNAKKASIDIRWKDYIHTPKRHQVYLWLGALLVVGLLSYLIWATYQYPTLSIRDRIVDSGIYLLVGILMVLRGIRIHFLRHQWFIHMDDLVIRYRMVVGAKVRNLKWTEIEKIKITFEDISFYLKSGKTRKVRLENVPDEDKIEEAKQAITSFSKTHSIPILR